MNLLHEFKVFLSYPRNMRVLLITNFIYALLLPAIDIFVAAYVMRNSHDVRLVMSYQLAVFTSTPLTFYMNGYLLRMIPIRRLYSTGMLLSAVSMLVLMFLPTLNFVGIILAGLLMGISFGMFWANRDFLALSTTNDNNRNYYYGLETFFYTMAGVLIPILIGWFIELTGRHGWFGGDRNNAYRIVAGSFFFLSILSSVVLHQGNFTNPEPTRFIFWRYHPLWYRMQFMAVLKGLTQGFMVTAPAMLVMKLLGQEGALGMIQTIGGILTAILLYTLGRLTRPRHRILILSAGLILFCLGGLSNALLFNATGVIILILCLMVGRQLLDTAYYPIQMGVIETLVKIENRNCFAYIFNHEFGLYIGRLFGCGLFIVMANCISDTAALRYTLLAIGILQLSTYFVAKRLIAICGNFESPVHTEEAQPIP
jgi:YQGE family putative transporter